MLDCEGIAYDQHGMPSFALIHSREYDRYVSLIAFDLVKLNGEDLRPRPLRDRKHALRHLVEPFKGRGIEFNEHIDGDGNAIFPAACMHGHEGIVAKRLNLPYQSGTSKRWLRIKNPASPAAKRLEEETF